VDGVSQKIEAVVGSADKALNLAVQAQFQTCGYLEYLRYGLFKMPPGSGQNDKVIHITQIDQPFVPAHCLIQRVKIKPAQKRRQTAPCHHTFACIGPVRQGKVIGHNSLKISINTGSVEQSP
jgi:hypothetical protein